MVGLWRLFGRGVLACSASLLASGLAAACLDNPQGQLVQGGLDQAVGTGQRTDALQVRLHLEPRAQAIDEELVIVDAEDSDRALHYGAFLKE